MLHVFLRHLRNITCTSSYLFWSPLHSLHRLSTTKLPGGWMHLHTARQQWHITKCNYWIWVTKASRVPSCHHILTRTAHTGRYNHRALCSALLHSHSQPELSGIVTFALSFIAICPHWIYCEILGFFFQRSFSCKSFWCTAAAVHDVMHFVQHWNHPCWRWCWLMIMCGGCFGGVSRSRRCCLQVSAESATTETTSLVLMPCSTEHSGVPFISVEYVMLHWVTLTIVFYIEI